MAVRHWMENNNIKGTVRLYGTPAEEGGSGKVYLVSAGLFEDVDTALHWHPSDRNSANAETSLANKSARFKFRGISSHAAAAPERGRSALDGVEAMNYMINMMREHVPQETRIHYVITQGGEAPNVVPDFAEVYYNVRHPQAKELQELWERVTDISQAAALGTGTVVEVEVMHGNHSLLPNEKLSRQMHANLTRVGGIRYNAKEQAFAEEISGSLDVGDFVGMEKEILRFELRQGMGSTDVGDVSWVVPTVGLRISTWVPGTAPHSWQAIAAGGTSIGAKGVRLSAKALSLTARDLFLDPKLIEAGRAEFEFRRGENFRYKALLGNREPPLAYRIG
jgi:aminobenzoyl-glutamate utilization protein B